MISLAVTLAYSFWMGDVPCITLFASIFDCDFVERTLEFKYPLLNLSETVGSSRRVAVSRMGGGAIKCTFKAGPKLDSSTKKALGKSKVERERERDRA